MSDTGGDPLAVAGPARLIFMKRIGMAALLNTNVMHRTGLFASEKMFRTSPRRRGQLRVLVTHAGKVLTHRQLLREVWGVSYQQETHMLRVNVSNLRRKIEPDPARPRHILTEPGVGYRLRAGG